MKMRKQATPEQLEKAAARREKIRGICKEIAGMSEAARLALADRVHVHTIEGRALSMHNQCLLASQNPAVTIVGGFRQWIKAGRVVRKGESGLSIWIPCEPGKAGQAAGQGVEPAAGGQDDGPADPGGQAAGQAARGGTRFMLATVFDVSQTMEIGQGIEPAAGQDDGQGVEPAAGGFIMPAADPAGQAARGVALMLVRG